MTQPRRRLTAVQILLVGAGTLVVLLCGIAAVGAVLPDRDTVDRTPATVVPTTVTTQPAPTSAVPPPASTPSAARTSTTTTTKKATTTTTTKKAAPTTTTTKYYYGVHPGAFCSPHWAYGYTSAGTLMQCKPSSTDTRFRWRAA